MALKGSFMTGNLSLSYGGIDRGYTKYRKHKKPIQNC
jgi:hypothetical protein